MWRKLFRAGAAGEGKPSPEVRGEGRLLARSPTTHYNPGRAAETQRERPRRPSAPPRLCVRSSFRRGVRANERRTGAVRAVDMVLAAFCFSVMSMLVKLVGARLPSQEVVFVRAAVSLAVAYVLVRRARPGNWGNRKGLLVLRGLMGFAALSCFFYALIHLPLADATVIQYTNPVWT